MPSTIEIADELASSTEWKNIVVLGGGAAAGYFVKEFVDAGRGAEVCIISEESQVPYEESVLSRNFLWKESPARLQGLLVPHCPDEVDADDNTLQTAEWYQGNGVEVITNVKIAKVDAVKKTLITLSGRRYGYDRLVIATGCR